ncbi:MAG: hypothetical protein KC933_15110 [Myxococcales bacterium]|nr:hypothetical protein [Myxococcales bacterium]MCB9645089.1 hypothetical protein [Deltaproteobacteria bacterium]
MPRLALVLVVAVLSSAPDAWAGAPTRTATVSGTAPTPEAAQPPVIEARGTEVEPVALEISPVFLPLTTRGTPVAPGFVGLLRLMTLTGRRLYWTPLVLGVGLGPSTGDLDAAVLGAALTEGGVAFRLGDREQVSLRAGLGLGFAAYAIFLDGADYSMDGIGFGISPTLRAEYHVNAYFFVGGSLRAVVAVPNDGGGVLFLSLSVGWSWPSG